MPTPAPLPDTSHTDHRFSPTRAGRHIFGALLAMAAISPTIPNGYSQPTVASQTQAGATSMFTYADVADLASRADVIAVARLRSFVKIPPNGNISLPGTQRFYVESDVESLIRGDAGLSNRIGFLLDVPVEVKPARALKGKAFVLFGRAANRAGQFQLLSSSALLPSSPATDTRVRTITAELLAQDAPPEIARVVEAFHVQGTVAGESETQVFLATKIGRPISLSIIRRPHMAPRFGAALGEIVDEAANVPPRDTLLWYRLACHLPSALPPGATMKLAAPSAQAAAADYRSFMDQLGDCERTRPALDGPSVAG